MNTNTILMQLILFSPKQEMTYDLAVSIKFLKIFQSVTKYSPTGNNRLPDVIFNNCENWFNNL